MKKILSIIGTIALVVIFIVLVSVISSKQANKYFKEISYEEYNTMKKDELLVYKGTSSSTAESLKQFSSANDLRMKELNTKDLEDETSEVIEYWRDNKLISTYTFDSFKLKDGEEEGSLQTVTMNEYLDIIKKDGLHFMFVGSENCGYCKMFKEEIAKFYEEYKINMYYLDLSTIEEEGYEKLLESDTYFATEQWGTPTTMIYYNGQRVEMISGYVDKDTIVSKLNDVYLKLFIDETKEK